MKTEKLPEKRIPTDEEINALAEWIQGLTIEQMMFLRESYENFLAIQSHEHGNGFVH